MALTKEWKEAILKKYQRGSLDTGSPEVQIALLSARINELTAHFKIHKKDQHSMRGLEIAVNRRRKLLNYLKRKDQKRYEAIISDLGLRK
jgi:small subunit ribosomal protein S15